jgi:hypothetical protein
VVYEYKEGICGSSRRLIGHQEAGPLGLTGADALDSYLVMGGFPAPTSSRSRACSRAEFATAPFVIPRAT